VPCARLSWPYRQLLSGRQCIVSYRITVMSFISPYLQRVTMTLFRHSYLCHLFWLFTFPCPTIYMSARSSGRHVNCRARKCKHFAALTDLQSVRSPTWRWHCHKPFLYLLIQCYFNNATNLHQLTVTRFTERSISTLGAELGTEPQQRRLNTKDVESETLKTSRGEKWGGVSPPQPTLLGSEGTS